MPHTHTVVHSLVVSVYFMNILTHDALVLVLEGITRKYGGINIIRKLCYFYCRIGYSFLCCSLVDTKVSCIVTLNFY